MSIRFCPDCGAECGQQDQECRECRFPLHLQLVSQSGDLIIQKSQLNRWHRIAQILRRNGIKIESKARTYPARFQLWWALPAVGAIIFLLTILFGGRLVDRLWPPVVQTAQVLDLNQVPDRQVGAPVDDNTSSEDADLGDVDTSFLKDALGSSDEQKVMTQDLNVNTEDYIDKQVLSFGEIQDIAERSLMMVTVGEERFRGTLVNEDLVLVETFTLVNAFQREKRTINKDGKFKTMTVFLVPEVGPVNGSATEAAKVMEDEDLGIALLGAPIGFGPDKALDFELDLAVGETVYVARVERGNLALDERRVQAPFQAGADVTMWQLDRSVDPQGGGAPVFDVHGALIGIFLFKNGQEGVLPLLRLRERAPQMYRKMLD